MFRSKLDKEIDRQMYVFLSTVPTQLHNIVQLLTEIRDKEVKDVSSLVEVSAETSIQKRKRGRPRKNPLVAA